MTVDELVQRIKGYKEAIFINVTSVYTDTKTFGGTFITQNGDIYAYGCNNGNGQFMQICSVPLDRIQDFKNYLANKVRVFDKRYQKIKIDNREYRSYVNFNNKTIDISNDFINIYEPTLYKDLCFKINYLIAKSLGIREADVNKVLSSTEVNIKSSLKSFKGEIKISTNKLTNGYIIKLSQGIRKYRNENKYVCYWAIKMLYEKYDNIFNAPGSKYRKANNINYLDATFKDSSFNTVEEKEVLTAALKSLFEEIRTLK